MKEQQDKQEMQNHDQMKKKFIREQLKPQRRKTVIRLMRKGFLVLCAAVLFGGISALSFYIMRIYFPWEELDEDVVAVPARVTSSQSVEERTVSEEIDPDLLASLEGFEKLSAQLAQVGAYANGAVVRLDIYDTSMSRDHRDAMKYCGILFHETAKSYYILTEYAVAQTARGSDVPVTAEFYCVKSAEAKVCGFSEKVNLAIFSVDKSQFSQKEQENIIIAELGDDSSLKLGSAVLAVGKPNGRFYSVNSGLITNDAISVPVLDQELQMYTINLAYQENRNGFVLNIQGQLVGMLTSKYKEETGEIDTAFFSLSSLASDLNQMIRGREVPYLGIYGSSVSGVTQGTLGNFETNFSAVDMETSGISGIYIEQVEPRSPAYQGGMRVADVITDVNGQAVQTMEELHKYLSACQSGQEVTLIVCRQGDSQSIEKKLKITLK